MPRLLYPKGKSPWIGGWVEPRAGLEAVVKGKIPSPRGESNPIVQAKANRYSLFSVLIHSHK